MKKLINYAMGVTGILMFTLTACKKEETNQGIVPSDNGNERTVADGVA